MCFFLGNQIKIKSQIPHITEVKWCLYYIQCTCRLFVEDLFNVARMLFDVKSTNYQFHRSLAHGRNSPPVDMLDTIFRLRVKLPNSNTPH